MLHPDHTGRLILIVSGVLAFLGGAAVAHSLDPAPSAAPRPPVATSDGLRMTARTAPATTGTELPDSSDRSLDLTLDASTPTSAAHAEHWTLKPSPLPR